MAVDLDPNALARTIGELRGLIRELQGKDAIMRAWTQQRGRAWVVYWNDPDGNQRQKACGTGRPGKMLAEKERRRLDAELVTDTYEQKLNKSWADFRQDYETVLAGMSAKAREQAAASLANFERIAKPSKVSKITTHTIDKFTSERRQEKARYTRKERLTRKRAAPYRDPPVVSPATVNADLRNIKAALRIAADWDYIKVVPKVRQLKEPERLPTYVPPTDFEKLYAACESARLPRCQGYTAADWWRAFLMTAALTGWRIGELIGLPRTAFDLAGGFAKVWNEKAKREELFPLHPSVIEHLRKLAGFSVEMLHWPHNRRTIDCEFKRLQKAAGVSDYSFHDLRRAFGTLNASRLAPAVLQRLMPPLTTDHAQVLRQPGCRVGRGGRQIARAA